MEPNLNAYEVILTLVDAPDDECPEAIVLAPDLKTATEILTASAWYRSHQRVVAISIEESTKYLLRKGD